MSYNAHLQDHLRDLEKRVIDTIVVDFGVTRTATSHGRSWDERGPAEYTETITIRWRRSQDD